MKSDNARLFYIISCTSVFTSAPYIFNKGLSNAVYLAVCKIISKII
jgi:hypothetical protein